MDVLIDSNVVIDTLQEREPFCADSKTILSLCIENKINGFATAHSLCDIFYIMRKDMSVAERLSLIRNLCKYLTVISETQDDFIATSSSPLTKDLEDGLQMECAKNYRLDYIVTRNVKDFADSKVKAIAPADFLKIAESSETSKRKPQIWR